MEKKYYLPEVEEFYVGFQFEGVDIDDDICCHLWKQYTVISPRQLFNVEYWIDQEEVRVKVLDREDIEDFGFQPMIPINVDDPFYPVNEWLIDTINNSWHIVKSKTGEYQINYGMFGSNKVYFNGTLRNKSELKRVLKLIGFTNREEDEEYSRTL